MSYLFCSLIVLIILVAVAEAFVNSDLIYYKFKNYKIQKKRTKKKGRHTTTKKKLDITTIYLFE
jgi:hypothetical protein